MQAGTLNREILTERLLALPGAIAACELQILEAETTRGHLAAHLLLVEDQMLLAGCLDGKNAETRAAQLRAGTAASRERVEEAQATVARLRISLHHLTNEHSSLRAITRLLAQASD